MGWGGVEQAQNLPAQFPEPELREQVGRGGTKPDPHPQNPGDKSHRLNAPRVLGLSKHHHLQHLPETGRIGGLGVGGRGKGQHSPRVTQSTPTGLG